MNLSRELLSAVLAVHTPDMIATEGNVITLVYTSEFNCTYEYNIHELAHKCKEWAVYKGYYLDSGFVSNKATPMATIYNPDGKENSKEDEIYFESNTEPEAIFKACEWLLKQKDSK